MTNATCKNWKTQVSSIRFWSFMWFVTYKAHYIIVNKKHKCNRPNKSKLVTLIVINESLRQIDVCMYPRLVCAEPHVGSDGPVMQRSFFITISLLQECDILLLSVINALQYKQSAR